MPIKPGMRLLYYAALKDPDIVLNDSECFLAHALIKGRASANNRTLLEELIIAWEMSNASEG